MVASSAQWVPAFVPPAAGDLERVGISRELAMLLARRGVADAESARRFLAPSLEHLHDPGCMQDLAPAIERIYERLTRGGKVAIVGDYDVDGISSAAMLSAVLTSLGGMVEVLLPDRQREGYGFQQIHAAMAKDRGCELIVTVDCGSSAFEAVERAHSLGMEVVVTDHHIPGGDLPSGALHVNPSQSRCTYPFPFLAAAGITFKVCTALLKRAGRAANVEALLRIACLGTIADLVPLLGENRVIAKLGLQALESAKSPGLRAMIERCGMRKPFSAEDIGFRIGPRLNAAGRLKDPYSALGLLLSRDAVEANRLVAELDMLNRERQEEESRVTNAARSAIRGRGELPGFLVAWSAEWPKGVVGLAAGKLASEFGRPVVLLTIDGSIATGSGRGTPLIDIHEFLSPWSGRLRRFGGHSQAIGLSVDVNDLEGLRSEWESAAAKWPGELFARRMEYEVEVDPRRIADGSLREWSLLAPFGMGNPRPLVRIGPLRLAGEPRTFGRGHISAEASTDGGGAVSLVGWGWTERRGDLAGSFEILGTIEVDSYSKRDIVRLVDARPS